MAAPETVGTLDGPAACVPVDIVGGTKIDVAWPPRRVPDDF